MGWVFLFLLLGLSTAGLWLLGVRGGLLMAAAAALFIGGAGYAFQGHPDLPGAPANGNAAARPSEAASGTSANADGAGGANATLAMGLSNLASTIQKGP